MLNLAIVAIALALALALALAPPAAVTRSVIGSRNVVLLFWVSYSCPEGPVTQTIAYSLILKNVPALP